MVAWLAAVCRAAEGIFQLLSIGFGEGSFGGFFLRPAFFRVFKKFHPLLAGFYPVFSHGVFDPPVYFVFGMRALFPQGEKAVGRLLPEERFRKPVVSMTIEALLFNLFVLFNLVVEFFVFRPLLGCQAR